MAAPRLRIYYGPQDEPQATVVPDTLPMRSTVTLPLGEILQILVEAVQNRRGWVQDF